MKERGLVTCHGASDKIISRIFSISELTLSFSAAEALGLFTGIASADGVQKTDRAPRSWQEGIAHPRGESHSG